MKDLRYLTACGCELEEYQINKTTDGRGFICKEHGGKVTHRTNSCLDCDNTHKLSARGNISVRCKPCQKEYAAIIKKARKKKPKKPLPLNVSQAIKIIENNGIRIEPGIYDIFKCGHAVRHISEGLKTKTRNNKSFMCCPVCKRPEHGKSSFLAKFKMCECGDIEMGSRLFTDLCSKCKRRANDSKKRINAGWSTNWRGDYCVLLSRCMAIGCYDCDSCGDFIGIFKGVDPGRRMEVLA